MSFPVNKTDFIRTISGDSVSDPFVPDYEGKLVPKQSLAFSHTTSPQDEPQLIFSVGIPGIPNNYVGSNSPVYGQGNDIVFDIILFNEAQPVTLEDWELTVILKKSVYGIYHLWNGNLNNGIYKIGKKENEFQVWIPAVHTSRLLAGTYFFDVVGIERAGKQEGIKPRTVALLTVTFQIEYKVSSPLPTSDSSGQPKANRAIQEQTYPPSASITQTYVQGLWY